MIRKLTLAAVLAVTTTTAFAEIEAEIEDYDFTFEGPFGAFDQNQLQRGLKIYTQSCAACHGLSLVSFRNLSDEGGPALP
uniref:cytochrome c1 n=1 Tax=Yoonia sp. TaxID=2212373 RepID=UPI0040481512